MILKDIFYFKATFNSKNSLREFTFSTKIYKINNCCNLFKYVFIIPLIYVKIIITLQNNIQLFDHNLYPHTDLCITGRRVLAQKSYSVSNLQPCSIQICWLVITTIY